jgi:hypothetical protein
MLPLLARYADAWNTGWYGSTDGLPEKIAQLEEACLAEGRDPQTVVKTVAISVAEAGYTGNRPNPIEGSVDDKVAFLFQLKELGFRHICVGLDPCTPNRSKRSPRSSKPSTTIPRKKFRRGRPSEPGNGPLSEYIGSDVSARIIGCWTDNWLLDGIYPGAFPA